MYIKKAFILESRQSDVAGKVSTVLERPGDIRELLELQRLGTILKWNPKAKNKLALMQLNDRFYLCDIRNALGSAELKVGEA